LKNLTIAAFFAVQGGAGGVSLIMTGISE